MRDIVNAEIFMFKSNAVYDQNYDRNKERL